MSLARKGNSPKFNQTANTKENNDNQNNKKQPSNSIDDVVNDIINTPKPNPKKQVSVYLETHVAKEFDKFGKRNGKGSKSELINRFLKKALKVQE